LTSYKRRPQMIVNTPFDIEILDEERVNQKIAASSPFWFVRKSQSVAAPLRKIAVQNHLSVEPQPVNNQPVAQIPPAQVAVDNSLPFIDINPQVANPLDINNDVVGKINDLYKNVKTGTRTVKRKKKAH